MFSSRIRSSGHTLLRLQLPKVVLNNSSRKFSINGSGLSTPNFRKSYQGLTGGLSRDKFWCCYKIKNKLVIINSIRYYTVPNAFNAEKEPIVQAQEASTNALITSTSEIEPIVNEVLEPATSNATIETAMKIGDLKAMGLVHYTPVGGIEALLEAIHVLTNTPWWGTILLGTLILRLLILPMSIDAMRANVKTMNLQPKVKQLMDEIKIARKYSDTTKMLKKADQLKEIYKTHDASPYRGIFLTLIQAPITISFFLATKRMAEFPVESFKTGGTLWFTDLTIPDPYYILPTLTTVGFLTILQTASMNSKIDDSQVKRTRWFIRGITVMSFPIIMNLPSSVLLYFTGSAMFSFLQTLALNNKKIRAHLKIPNQLYTSESNPFLDQSESNFFSNLFGKFSPEKKEALTIRKRKK